MLVADDRDHRGTRAAALVAPLVAAEDRVRWHAPCCISWE
jgi:hypothetical protein